MKCFCFRGDCARILARSLSRQDTMSGEPRTPGLAEWARAVALDQLQPSRPIAVKVRGKHIAVFLHNGQILACNNQCPHEGYPLVEGTLDANCVLTCHWHNWKFDLKSGVTLNGGDNLRIYPVKVEGSAVWLDTRDPPAAERAKQALQHLDEAMAEYDTARIARELARLGTAGTKAEVALVRAIQGTYARLPDGMTHAYAAAEAWLRLRETLAGEARRLAGATEALVHIAFDALRETTYPFTAECASWNDDDFAAAIEAQDEEGAVALLNGALAQGMHFANLEPALAAAALAHYNDFGHSLIYLMHVRRLIERLGLEVERPLLLAWLRSLVLATREDLLPEFAHYADALAAWPASARCGCAPPGIDAFEGQSVHHALNATVAAAGCPPLDVYFVLVEACARHLLRFDERHALRTDRTVANNVGWLDFSHGLTFGHALRQQCARQPHLWPQGLLQLALFVGRNRRYLDPNLTAKMAILEWGVGDATAFHERAIATIVDHGIGLPIFPAHWLKTWTAMRDEVAAGLPAATHDAVLAAVNRLLAVRFKERHALRTARQALSFVRKED